MTAAPALRLVYDTIRTMPVYERTPLVSQGLEYLQRRRLKIPQTHSRVAGSRGVHGAVMCDRGARGTTPPPPRARVCVYAASMLRACRLNGMKIERDAGIQDLKSFVFATI